ncbi:MAG: hypothetical protein CMJ06_00055 [Pelagibacterales bacterium]|nr:hypothetical protein [Pelagibacterales bacterium]
MKVGFIYNDIYRYSVLGKKHPILKKRISNVFDLSKILNFNNVKYFNSKIASNKQLLIFHDKDYVDVLRVAEKTQKISLENKKKYNIGTVSNPIFKEMYRRHAISTGSLILGSDLILNNELDYIFSPGSGAHHGKKNQASGFCYFNDIATCILYLKKKHIKRIVYFDMDAHYGDGVMEYFKYDNNVLNISLHQKDLWPRNGNYLYNDYVISLPLEHGFNDIDFKNIFEKKIESKIKKFEPEIAILQMGADCLNDDHMSKLCLSNNAMRFTIEKFKDLSKKLIVMGGGGYNPWVTLRAWIYNLAVLANEPNKIVLLDEGKRFLKNIEWKKKPKHHWINQIADVPNIFNFI